MHCFKWFKGNKMGLIRAAALHNSRSTNHHPELGNSMALDLFSVVIDVSTATNAGELPEERYKLPEDDKRVRRRKGKREHKWVQSHWGGRREKEKRWSFRWLWKDGHNVSNDNNGNNGNGSCQGNTDGKLYLVQVHTQIHTYTHTTRESSATPQIRFQCLQFLIHNSRFQLVNPNCLFFPLNTVLKFTWWQFLT